MSEKDIDRAVLYLTPAERETAHKSTSMGTKEQRERTYVEMKEKLRVKRLTGEYHYTTDAG